MAGENIDVYTKILKRIADALLNLQDGLSHADTFRTSHNIDTNLTAEKGIPTGYTKDDYEVSVLIKDIDDLLVKHKTFIDKFKVFDNANVLDPLDMLGKKFYMFGTKEQITR